MIFQRDPPSPERDRRVASVAVVPFDPVPLAPEAARIAHGFLEDVIAELARLPDVEVLAARTSLSLTPEQQDPRRLMEAYGVTHLLDAAVRPGPGGVQVKVNLVEAQSGRTVWADRYEAPLIDAGAVLEEIAVQVANRLTARVTLSRLAEARHRPLTSLPAQDCWLRGLECLRKATPEGDEDARKLFQRALSIDPTYARAYAGLSVSHFKRWNWRHATPGEAEDDRLCLQYMARAEALDEMDPVVHVVAGRLQVYRRNFGEGRRHLERALELSPNRADGLMQMSPLWAYLGEPERALEMAAKAFRLNPLHEPWYYFVSFIPHFLARKLETGLAILERSPPDQIFEQAALMAASYAHLGRLDEARAQAPKFLLAYLRDIAGGRPASPEEAVRHLMDSNPFARDEDARFLLEGLGLAGLPTGQAPIAAATAAARPAPEDARFARKAAVWEIEFGGRRAVLPDSKGCADLAVLLASPRERVHCMELAGRLVEGDSGAAMDSRARAACQRRIQDLQAEMAEAERHNDFARTERLGEELDAVIEQLSAAVGLGGRGRKLGDPAEKARTAVTWRIRSAIRKIAEAHPPLGRHLEASIRTGAFCAYQPEHPVRWTVS
jgi:TolB-like protein/tetratricopeptide (TPR) repeat protein